MELSESPDPKKKAKQNVKKLLKDVLILPVDWVGAISWPALDGKYSTGVGGELLSTTSTKLRRHNLSYLHFIKSDVSLFVPPNMVGALW